jgi:hypothetical protein
VIAFTSRLDVDALRERLRAMSDADLLRFWRAAAYLITPEANLGRPPRDVFRVQLSRAEWRRRKLTGEVFEFVSCGHCDAELRNNSPPLAARLALANPDSLCFLLSGATKYSLSGLAAHSKRPVALPGYNRSTAYAPGCS